MSEQPYPGYEGSVGPFPGQYGRPHVYARDVHSGAGNCVCGRDPRHRMHPELAPGVPNMEAQPDGILHIQGDLTEEQVAEFARRFGEAVQIRDSTGRIVQ
jgi:hypothetical protein